MIKPTRADIGRKVVYRMPGTGLLEEGVIVNFNVRWAYIRYGSDIVPRFTLKQSLEWATGDEHARHT